jgi:hypothetical protein
LAKTTIGLIYEAFKAFDFRPLLPPLKEWPLGPDSLDTDVAKIWNATHLFFLCGLFDERPFPAICHGTLPSLTLEDADKKDRIENPTVKKRSKKRSNQERKKGQVPPASLGLSDCDTLSFDNMLHESVEA